MKLEQFNKKHINSKLKINRIVTKYMHEIFGKNKENIDWLSSNLQGVHKISFTDSDVSRLFKELDIDEAEFEHDISKIDGIIKEWKTSTIPFNVLLATLMHNVIKNKGTDADLNKLFMVLAFKIVTSAYSNYFKYQVDEPTARLVYDKMSNKYLIKKLGSNFAVLNFKAQYIYDGTKNNKFLKEFDVESMVLALNSISGSVRQYIHTGFLLLLEVLEGDNSSSTISLYNSEGRMSEITNDNKMYYNNMERVLISKSLLYNRQIMGLVSEIVNIDSHLITKTLDAMRARLMKNPDEVLSIGANIVDSTLYYLYRTEFYPPYDESIDTLINYLQSYWKNSKVRNEEMHLAKNAIQKIILEDTGIHRMPIVVKTSISVSIYLFLLSVLLTKR